MFAFVSSLILCLSPGCARSQTGEPIQVVVLVILGTDQNKDVSEKLKDIAPELRKKDDRLTGFLLHKTLNPMVKMGDTVKVELIGKANLTITIHEKTDDEGRLILTIQPPKLDDVKYACTCGKFFPILTNFYTPDKQRLIIAVMAKPCKKK